MSGRQLKAAVTTVLMTALVVAVAGCGVQPQETTRPSQPADSTSSAPAKPSSVAGKVQPAAPVPSTSTSIPPRPNVHCGGAAPPISYGTAKLSAGVQTIRVETKQNYFGPNNITAAGKLPLVLEFAGRTSCIEAIRLPALGISATLKAGATSVRLPALKPGVYDFQCSHGIAFGKIFVAK